MITQLPRRKSAFRSVAALSALGLVSVLAACGDDDGDEDAETGAAPDDADCELHEVADDPALAEYQENGITLSIANERPYGYEEDGEITGEAPALGEEIFCRMGIDVEFSTEEWGALISGLNAGRLDVIAAGMFITPERAEEALFSDPDYCAKTSFAVEEGNPHDISEFESFIDSDATLGVLDGAVEQGYAEDLGVPSDQIEAFQETTDLFDALEVGRIDAVSLTEQSIETNTDVMEGFEATESFFPVVNDEEQFGCGAFAFRDEDLEVRNLFNEVLHDMQDADEVLPVVEPFGFDQETVDQAKGVTANDLANGAYDDLGDPPASDGDSEESEDGNGDDSETTTTTEAEGEDEG